MARHRTGGGIDYESYKWRYREVDGLGWLYAETLADVYADNVDQTDRPVEVQKRTGTRRGGYGYKPHATLNPERPAAGGQT